MRASVWWGLVAAVGAGAAACGVQPAERAPLEPQQAAVEQGGPPSRDTTLRSLAPPSLRQVPVPRPAGLSRYVRDEAAAVALGKAFFWDMQVGSDGQTACASCHFHAGADVRAAGSLHPGANGVREHSAGTALRLRDFPFRKRVDPASPTSPVLSDSDDVVGSRGVPRRLFTGVTPGSAVEQGSLVADPMFDDGSGKGRQVTARNAPSVINSVFNFRNFWDGRASPVFNGRSPFGADDADAQVWVDDGGGLGREPVRLDNAALASQAMGPPPNSAEMAWEGRPWPLLGRKMLALEPLAVQHVHPTDSVLGPLADASGVGLRVSYAELISRAFQPRFWASAQRTPEGHTQMEANFPLFWGLALQLYQATLVSDDTPFDRYMDGADAALTEEQKDGMLIFYTTGRCSRCHVGSEFTATSVGNVLGQGRLLSRMDVAFGTALYDTGFYNLGVRTPQEDAGLGGADPFGTPLAFAWRLAGRSADPALQDVCARYPGICALPPQEEPAPEEGSFLSERGADATARPTAASLEAAPFADGNAPERAGPAPFERVAAQGAFKTPGLRNVELTGPFMHNGSMATLEQVVDFYARKGDFHEENQANLAPHLLRVDLELPNERAAVVAFLKALTDERVRLQQAPFDHPELVLPDGQRIEAVGAAGGAPLLPFEQLLEP